MRLAQSIAQRTCFPSYESETQESHTVTYRRQRHTRHAPRNGATQTPQTAPRVPRISARRSQSEATPTPGNTIRVWWVGVRHDRAPHRPARASPRARIKARAIQRSATPVPGERPRQSPTPGTPAPPPWRPRQTQSRIASRISFAGYRQSPLVYNALKGRNDPCAHLPDCEDNITISIKKCQVRLTIR